VTLDAYWATARRVCTAAELAALELRDKRGMSPRVIAMVLNKSRWTVRDHLDNADRKIAAAMTHDPDEEAA